MNQIQEQKRITPTQLIQSPLMQKKLQEVLGEKKNTFVASLMSALSTNKQLANCEPNSVIFAALTAASLDLPINSSLGFAHIVPYNSKKDDLPQAQFQIGYKGFIQLAIRSGQYRVINALEVKEGEFKGFNKITEEIKIEWNDDEEERAKLLTAGYVAYFELMNGFKKTIYWSKEKMEVHAKTYSQAYKSDLKYNSDKSFWTQDFDGQGLKTVLKQLISKWGIMSIEMQKAIETDQAVITENEVTYIDNIEEVTLTDKEVLSVFQTANGNNETVKKALNDLGYGESVREVKKTDYEKLLAKINELNK